jgi:hypothetical protein
MERAYNEAMARAERRALLAVKTAKWISFLLFLALVAASLLGADVREASPGVILLFWTMLAFAMQLRIEKGGVTKEHPGVAIVQAALWPGLHDLVDAALPVLAGFALVSLAFVVAGVLLQHALHAARKDERSDAERRAHRRLGLGMAVLAVALAVLVRPAPEDPPLALVAPPLFFAFLAWSAAHGFYVGVTRALLLVLVCIAAVMMLVLAFEGRGPTKLIPLGVIAAAGLVAFAGRPVSR